MNILLALSYYDPRIHQGIVEEAKKRSWMINAELVFSSNIPQQWDGDGIICSLENNQELNHYVLNSGKPFVDLSDNQAHSFPRVLPSLASAGKIAAEHFMDRSFENFATYGQTENWWNLRSRQAFEESLKQYGKQAEHWLWSPDQKTHASSKERFEWLKEKLRTAPKPLALYCFNDQLAQDVINVAYQENLKIPADIAVLGANNYELICPYLPSPLSSIDLNMEEIGRQAVCCLEQVLQQAKGLTVKTEVPLTGIITRASTEVFAVNHPLVSQAIFYIAKHYKETCSIAEIAETLRSSESTVRRLFKQHVGHGIKEEVKKRRLKEAVRLLKEGKQVQSIFRELGFYDSAHFGKAFKAVHGLSVREWKVKAGIE